MIDFDTLLIMLNIQDLATKSKYGIFPLSTVTPEQTLVGVVYDDSRKIDEERYPVILTVVDCGKEPNEFQVKKLDNLENDSLYRENDITVRVWTPEPDGDIAYTPSVEIELAERDCIIENCAVHSRDFSHELTARFYWQTNIRMV
jgi:hypothetical protein